MSLVEFKIAIYNVSPPPLGPTKPMQWKEGRFLKSSITFMSHCCTFLSKTVLESTIQNKTAPLRGY